MTSRLRLLGAAAAASCALLLADCTAAQDLCCPGYTCQLDASGSGKCK